ncbi:MAG: PrgI family protein [Candidatus Liptonbacteria bacterium]|nr:PrgI family protein [Candidatus Liptonbacteria bacterium]MBI3114512.1 PrgI family protein [Candidatus Harrisonbacteria bacterium]
MQFQVPQFIETEDKIVGPFTLKQFIAVGAAVGVSLVLYLVVVPWLWLVLSIPLVGGGIAFAFVRVGGRALPSVALAALRYLWKPQTYVWQPEAQGTRDKEQGTKTEEKTGGLSLEEVLSGLSLRRTWQKLQTGAEKLSPGLFLAQRDRYSIYRKRSGERSAARRIDYR